MKIETVLQDLRRELPVFKETSARRAQEDESKRESIRVKTIQIADRIRTDANAIFQFMSQQGFDGQVEEPGNPIPAITLRNRDDEGGRLDFDCNGDEIICRYSGREPEQFAFTVSSVDYERDLLPVLAKFIPYALGSADFKWS